jgi:hypothetical protein
MAQREADVMSRAALARKAGVSSTTLRNWSNMAEHPLEARLTDSGARVFSWSALLQFCDHHPDLHGVAAVRAQQRIADAGLDDGDGHGDATLRTALQEMRRALDANLAAIARATELATETAGTHAQVVAALQQTIRALEVAAVADQRR